jgi:hypothetical protein
MCYVKATKSEHHLDTVHFKHKNITNPTITHADKVMQALAECVKTMRGATGGTTAQEAKDLQHIVKATWAALHKSEAPINNSNAKHQAPRMPELPKVHTLPKVPPTTADNQWITRAMSDSQNRKQSSISRNRIPFPAISKVINKTISAFTTMSTSAPSLEPTSKPTSVPTTSAKQDRLQK